MDDLLSPDEREKINQEAALLDDAKIAEEIEQLARREMELLSSPGFREGEMREITLWNLTVLVAAADRLSPGRTGPPEP